MPDEKIVDATVELERFRQRHCNDSIEVKFKAFKGKPWAVCELMDRLGKIGLVPLYVIAEKRYCIAAKIVETFLDPYFNSQLASPFTIDIETKQQLANLLYESLSASALEQFADAYRHPTQAGFVAAISRIATECQQCINPELADLLLGSLPQLGEIAQAEVTAVETWGKGMGTINLPLLISFLMIVEQLAREECFVPRKVVHDEQGVYQDDYLRAFEHHRSAEGGFFIEGMSVPYGAIRLIENFEIQRSVDQPLIQAADLLAGSIAHLAIRVSKGEQLHDQEVELSRLTLPPMLFHDLTIAMPVCSNKIIARFGEAIRLAFPSVFSDVAENRKPDLVQWTGLPGSGPLPLLPKRPSEITTTPQPDRTLKITLPLFGIARLSDDDLTILLPPEIIPEEASEWERIVPLWTSRLAAESLLNAMSWNEPQHVIEFDAPQFRKLVACLREASQFAGYVRLDPHENDAPPIPINLLADDIERLDERCARAAKSGVLKTLFKHHTIAGLEIDSMLLSSGKYAAIHTGGEATGSGLTRDDAIKDLLSKLGNGSAS